nr:hypothetical protein [Tanacetum cinerariifolium]
MWPPVNVQSKNVGNASRNVGKVGNSGNVVFAQQGNGSNAIVQRHLRISANSGNAHNVQCYNYNEKGHYARVCPKPRVHDSNYFKEQMLLAKKDEAVIDLNIKENDFLLDDVHDSEKLELLNAACIKMATLQSVNKDSNARPSYDSDIANEINDYEKSLINDMFANHDQEQCYTKQTESIKPTYDDDQIDSNNLMIQM